MGIVDQADLVAERVEQFHRANAVAHVRDRMVQGAAQRDDALDFLLDAVHAPVRHAALRAWLAARQQPKFEAADIKTDIERLVEIRRRVKYLAVPGFGLVQVGDGIGDGA